MENVQSSTRVGLGVNLKGAMESIPLKRPRRKNTMQTTVLSVHVNYSARK
jgi:hypothetical protein